MSIQQIITVSRGSVTDWPLETRIGGARETLTGGEQTFTVRDANNVSGTLLISKSSNVPGEIDFLDQSAEATKGDSTLRLLSADSEDLTVGGDYWWKVQTEYADGRKLVTASGRFKVDSRLKETP